MKKLKYIVFDVSPFEVPVVWPDDVGLSHKDVARSVHIGQPISAGFTNPESWEVHGRSVSLNLLNRHTDAALLRKYYSSEKPAPVPPAAP